MSLFLSHFLTPSISPFLSLLSNLASSYFPFIFNSMFILSGAISLAFVPPAHTSYRVADIKSKLGAKPPSSCDSRLWRLVENYRVRKDSGFQDGKAGGIDTKQDYH